MKPPASVYVYVCPKCDKPCFVSRSGKADMRSYCTRADCEARCKAVVYVIAPQPRSRRG